MKKNGGFLEIPYFVGVPESPKFEHLALKCSRRRRLYVKKSKGFTRLQKGLRPAHLQIN
jgi:hypothetical protein